MRFSLRHYSLWIAAILLVATTSCSDNDEPDSVDYESLSGVWYGTRCYNNNGAVKYQNITLTLNQDKTGSMEYESEVSFSAARFTWSISGDRLICQGAYASTSGDISGSYNLECRIEKDRLYPTGQFSYFILTKDNSVMTDGEGNEIASAEDQLYMLQNVWVSTDKKSVIEFYPGGEYDEYVLSYPGSNDYTEFNTGKYHFNPLLKTLTVNTTLWEVVTLDRENLVLKKEQPHCLIPLGRVMIFRLNQILKLIFHQQWDGLTLNRSIFFNSRLTVRCGISKTPGADTDLTATFH